MKRAVVVSLMCVLLVGVSSATVTDLHLYKLGEIDGTGGTLKTSGSIGGLHGTGASVGAIKDSLAVDTRDLNAYINPNSDTYWADLLRARPFYKAEAAPMGGGGVAGTKFYHSEASLHFKQADHFHGTATSGWQSNTKGSLANGNITNFQLANTPTGIEAWCRPGFKFSDGSPQDAQAQATGFYFDELSKGVRMNLISLKDGRYVNSNQDQLSIFTKNGTWWMAVGGRNGANADMVDSGVAVDWDSWQHMAAVYDNGIATLYMNGEAIIDSHAKTALAGDTWNLSVGGGQTTSGDTVALCSFMGLVDEARMFQFESGAFDASADLNYIPEPATLAILSLGMIALRRRK